MATEPRSTLARMLAEITPGNLAMAFFTNGGAEANENAIKLARWYTGRHKVIARYRSYHGATAGSITMTGDPRRWPAEPGIPGVVRMFDPYTYRCPAGHPDPCPVCTGAPHLEEILQYEGPHTVAAVILETVTGTNGIIVPPDGYLRSIREVCDRHGILLIADEVIAGFGRTGKRIGVDNWDVVPDTLRVAKRITSCSIPLGPMPARRLCPGRALHQGGARPRPLPDDALERRHGLPAADDHARRARGGDLDPRRGARDRGRAHRLTVGSSFYSGGVIQTVIELCLR